MRHQWDIPDLWYKIRMKNGFSSIGDLIAKHSPWASLRGTSNGCYVEKIETNGRSLSDVDDIQTVLKKAGGKAGDRAEKITDAYYFKGDYTNTYEKVMEMQADSSDYNLITRNCLQQTLEAFMASDQRFKFVSYGLVNGVVPNEAVRRVAMIPSQKEKTPWKLIFVAMFSL